MLSEFNAFCGQYENIIKAFGVLTPAFIAFMTFFVAFKQWETAERQRRKELFEMRYGMCKTIFESIEIDTVDKLKLKGYEFNERERKEKYDKNKEILRTYSYLFKRKDMNKVNKLYDEIFEIIEKDNKNKEKLANGLTDINRKISDIFDPYLRIEPEETFWDILKRRVIITYEFLFPKWSQKFFSKQAKTSVILNSFQNFAKKKEEPTDKVK
jgi:hypothetical protein